ncbi:MAG: hypothetical protein FWH19_04570 [Treponema sp.]|nr:hypothetical protein [Treponema sp.]
MGPLNDQQTREKGFLIYPVYSRRSRGLSVGINLFPDDKLCSFDCPYCEVFPFQAACSFSLPLMETALAETLDNVKAQGIEVRDICFSGNGEPVMSPHFAAALESAFRIRDRAAPEAELVLISNAGGLLEEETFELLHRAAAKERGLRIWLKLDAATPQWYALMNRSSIPHAPLIEKIRAFVKCTPLTLQTMLCAIDGSPPPPEEERAWEKLVLELAASAAEIREVQIYGKARPAPEDPLAAALPNAYLDARAASLKSALAAAGRDVPVGVYY